MVSIDRWRQLLNQVLHATVGATCRGDTGRGALGDDCVAMRDEAATPWPLMNGVRLLCHVTASRPRKKKRGIVGLKGAPLCRWRGRDGTRFDRRASSLPPPPPPHLSQSSLPFPSASLPALPQPPFSPPILSPVIPPSPGVPAHRRLTPHDTTRGTRSAGLEMAPAPHTRRSAGAPDVLRDDHTSDHRPSSAPPLPVPPGTHPTMSCDAVEDGWQPLFITLGPPAAALEGPGSSLLV